MELKTKHQSDVFFVEYRIWDKLRAITGRAGPKRFLLAKLLRKNTAIEMLQTFSEEDKQTCLSLIGANGYAFYRLLCVKHDLDPESDYTPTIYGDGFSEEAITKADNAQL